MKLFPCTLVYLDEDAAPGPNSTNRDPLSYVTQALCLNNSLRRVGLPMLTIVTNAPERVAQRFAGTPPEHWPAVTKLAATIELPKNMPFYAAHFKLDLMDQVAASLPDDTMMLLLDADMVALLPLDRSLIDRCAEAGIGAFDISDQVFPAYGSESVVADLEIVADRRLRNPRWYGGEFLLATPASLRRLVPRARAYYARYLSESARLEHHGDEAFISAALNTLVDEGQPLVEVGAYQAVGRHWAGNNYRDVRWFRCCSFVHLPGGKALLEREARFVDFAPDRFWRHLRVAHLRGRARHALKRIARVLNCSRLAMWSAFAIRGAKG
ncbi:hypothetical protein LFL96_33795 [Paraburkholderia sp. D15]|uniref:hypothetical protein n=1 Tax=Paraburkholderia sp. D15 TaxID=2880218 RepID=UPI00247AA2C0|nr:hypothetical protein [Paraburkholderia sp. D15]WGS53143.1 hypothetical protein LFL96_33795 [Paraburkholderia sp. D15]WKF61413.1 hypothetical protein HUO10_005944 [Paraburkholderia busanensis]